jgi:cyclohexyl-isocyanide hydratase
VKVAFVIFEDLTTLDFVGVYDAVTRLKTMNFIPELEWEICSFTERVVDGIGLIFTQQK